MKRGHFAPILLVGIVFFFLTSVLGCGGGSGNSSSTPGPKPVPVPQSITVVPAIPTIAAGTTQQLVAIAHFGNHTSALVTQFAHWTSSASGFATVGNTAGSKGLVSGASPGTTEVTAEVSGVSSSTTVTVTAATLTSITVIPPTPDIPTGAIVPLSAVGNFSDGTTQDLTASAVWSSSNAGIATVGNSQADKGELDALAAGSTTITATDLGMSGSVGVTIRPPSLVALTIEPPESSLPEDTTKQLVAIGTYSDDTTQDLTTVVKWKSSDPNIAQVGKNKGEEGQVRAKKVGNTTITATDSGMEASSAVAVTPPALSSISVTPPHAAVANGTSVQLTATGVYSNGDTQDLTRTVSWTSSAPANAVVSGAPGSEGLVTGIAAGSATITAAQDGASGTSSVVITPPTLVSISITPAFVSIAKGTTQQLTATGNFSDGTTQDITNSAGWISLSPRTAAVSSAPGSKGLVTGLSVGGATIRVTQAGISDNASVIVTPATLVSIAITPVNPSIAKGTRRQLVATGTFSDNTTQNLTRSVSWVSSSPSVAIVGNRFPFRGVVFGRDVGTATITATEAGISGTTSLTVTGPTLSSITITPPNPSLANGTTLQLTATGTFSDRTTQDITASVSWVSSDPENAVVSNADGSEGLVTGTGVGRAIITATENGISGNSTVRVTAAVLSSITITPANPSIAKGTTQQLTATGVFSDGTTQDFTRQVSWTSSDQTVAEVDNALRNQGLVSGIALGTATITATENGISGTTVVTVTAPTLSSITITPPLPSLANGTSLQLGATATFSDGTTQDLTEFVSWSSTHPEIAVVSNAEGSQGLVTGTEVGSTTIIATLGGVSGSSTVTVTPATLSSIVITPPNFSIARGTTQQLTATGVFTDSTTQDLTRDVSWTSSDQTIAVVDNALRNQGLVSGVGVGTATITATEDGISGSTTVTVTGTRLTSVTVTPPNPSIGRGTTQQLFASCILSDGTSQDCTSQASWISSSNATAVVSNDPASKGLVYGISAGTATITASLGGISGSTTVTVTSAAVTRITLTPLNQSAPPNASLTFNATARYSDGSTQTVTPVTSFISSNPGVATFSSSVPGSNILSTVAVGTTTVTATFQGFQDSSPVTVVGPTSVTSITVTPANSSIARSTQQQLTATCNYSDGSITDCTTQASWVSSSIGTAVVCDCGSSKGLVYGISAGTATITATFLGASGSTDITVTSAALTGITLTPVNPAVAPSNVLSFHTVAHFADGSSQIVTPATSFTSSNTAVGVFSGQAPGANALFAVNVGTTTVTATFQGFHDSTVATVQ